MKQLTFGSLFAGIGGLDLGLERSGMRCAWQCEIDDYATRVLAKHWPAVQRERDVRTCGAHNLAAVDLICGGFPCQDISEAGRREGIGGERSGLWRQFKRIIGELRPRYVLVENVSALLGRGIEVVLGDLAEIGYDAEWSSLPAAAFGAPHFRERIFIVAYPNSINGSGLRFFDGAGNQTVASQSTEWVSNGRSEWVTDGQGNRRIRRIPDCGICRVVDGIPARMERLRGLGNAVVPQVAEFIGRQIVEFDARLHPPTSAPLRSGQS